jgi:hypothetical protein
MSATAGLPRRMDMGEPHVVSALRDKRAELSGLILDLEKRIGQTRADLVYVDAVLRLFGETEPAVIAPKKPAPARSPYFADGELSRRCLDGLRRAEEDPIAAHDIAVQAMRDKGLDTNDIKTRSDFIRRILWALGRLKDQGHVEKVGHGLGARWKITA